MKIVLIIPGSGDAFYCGNCFRDHLYAQALRRAGHDVVVMPLYLPFTDPQFGADTPLFFPATSYFVAQKYFGRRKMPRFFEKVLDIPSMLRIASSFSGATSAKGMEQITLSMIQGDDPHFIKQVKKMIDWMVLHDRPDVIHLSTSMLIGIAKAIKSQIDIPIVCSLQDEEIWLDGLEERQAKEAWDSIRDNLLFVNRFVASSEFYKRAALQKMPEIGAIDVVYPGVDIEKYGSLDYPEAPTIGFFYRMSYQNGLDIVARAFVKLKKEGAVPRLKLKIGGGFTRENRRFIRRIHRMLKPYAHDVIWSERYTLAEHAAFYRDISLICVPVRFDEAVGLYLCEAFAAGRPAVEPDTGSFAEIVSEGGVLYRPHTSEALAGGIKKLLTDTALYAQCCQEVQQLSQNRYNDKVLVEGLHRVYGRVVVG